MITPRPAPAPLEAPRAAAAADEWLDLTVEQLEQWVETGNVPVLEEWLAASPE